MASTWDEAARDLARQWAAYETRLLTPRDLSTPGFCHTPGGGCGDTVVAGGERVPVRSIRGVFVRIPAVTEWDLPHITPPDRAYVASEMTAFLASFLGSLACPVVPRPHATYLSGEPLSPERCARLAWQAGVPARASKRRVARGAPSPQAEAEDAPAARVTVIESECFGQAISPLGDWAVALAREARRDVLEAVFAGSGGEMGLREISPWPDTRDAAAAHALARWLLRGPEAAR